MIPIPMDATHPAKEEEVLVPDHPRDLVIAGLLAATEVVRVAAQSPKPEMRVAPLTGGT